MIIKSLYGVCSVGGVNYAVSATKTNMPVHTIGIAATTGYATPVPAQPAPVAGGDRKPVKIPTKILI